MIKRKEINSDTHSDQALIEICVSAYVCVLCVECYDSMGSSISSDELYSSNHQHHHHRLLWENSERCIILCAVENIYAPHKCVLCALIVVCNSCIFDV